MTRTVRSAWPLMAACMMMLSVACLTWSAPAKPRPAAPAATKPATGDILVTPTTSPAERARQRRQFFQKARKVAALNRRLTAYFKAEQFDKCEPLIKQIIEIAPKSPIAWYNYACYFSRVGQGDKAIESLTKAIEHGYSSFGYLERDPDLEAARKLPGYKKLRTLQDRVQRERASKVRDALVEQFGQDYAYEIDHDHRMVFATNVDSQTLSEMKQRLTAYAMAQWKDLFENTFEKYLTIVIPKKEDWRWGPTVGGFYSRASNMLIARTVGLTLVHEFTHALHRADQEGFGQSHPIWMTEGLATLFESSRIVDGHALPAPNSRLNALQRLLRRKDQIPLAELIRASQPKFMQNPTASYSEVRYFMMYLHSKGMLRKWYDAYVEGYDSDRTGRAALEKVFGKKLDKIEADWHKWVMDQKPALTRLPPDSAYIGIQLAQAIDGVEIIRIVPGGGADKAGLKPGDVILQVDDVRTIEPAQLMNVVNAHDAGDKVKIRYRRDGKYEFVTVTLTKMPAARRLPRRRRPRPAATAPATRPATTAPSSRPAVGPPKRRTLPPPRKTGRKKAA